MNVDPLLVIGLLMLGMAMGAMLSYIQFKRYGRRVSELRTESRYECLGDYGADQQPIAPTHIGEELSHG